MRRAPVATAIAGAVLLVLGVIMIPAPGPGVMIAGFGVVLLVVATALVIAARLGERPAEM